MPAGAWQAPSSHDPQYKAVPHRCTDGGADGGLGDAEGVAGTALLAQGADADFLALVGLAAGADCPRKSTATTTAFGLSRDGDGL